MNRLTIVTVHQQDSRARPLGRKTEKQPTHTTTVSCAWLRLVDPVAASEVCVQWMIGPRPRI
jgi:hypothetical protein